MEYIFELEMQVRDYECDMEGIVNNAIYQHYLEHTRHEFLASSGISFIEMHERGVDPVVNRIEINYKHRSAAATNSSANYTCAGKASNMSFIKIFTRLREKHASKLSWKRCVP